MGAFATDDGVFGGAVDRLISLERLKHRSGLGWVEGRCRFGGSRDVEADSVSMGSHGYKPCCRDGIVGEVMSSIQEKRHSRLEEVRRGRRETMECMFVYGILLVDRLAQRFLRRDVGEREVILKQHVSLGTIES